jgi:hypothetical protein
MEAKAAAFRAGEQVTWNRALSADEVNEFARLALDPGWKGSTELRDDGWYILVASKTADGEVTRTAIPAGRGGS